MKHATTAELHRRLTLNHQLRDQAHQARMTQGLFTDEGRQWDAVYEALVAEADGLCGEMCRRAGIELHHA